MKAKIIDVIITMVVTLFIFFVGEMILPMIFNNPPIWLGKCICLVIMILFIYCTRKNIKKTCRLNKINFKLGLKFIPISMFLTSVSLILILSLSYVFPNLDSGTQGATELYSALKSSMVGIIVLTIIGPITEELICRGYLLTRFSEIVSVRSAIILQAIFFAMLHGGSLKQVDTFITAIIWGYFCYYTNSLIPSLIMHIVNNTTITAISLLPETGKYILFIINILLGILGIYFLWGMIKEFKNKEKVLQKEIA